MVQAIIFDCFGVLTADLWREFTVTLSDEQRYKASRLNHAYCAGSLTAAEFLREVSRLTGVSEEQVGRIIHTQGEGTSKNTRLLELIAELKPDYKIGLLSNVASSWIQDSFLTSEERKLFDSFILSYEVGAAKPDPRMFELAAQRLGVPLTDCLLVDDVERYCAAARRLGMQAVVYQDFDQTEAELQKLLTTQSGK